MLVIHIQIVKEQMNIRTAFALSKIIFPTGLVLAKKIDLLVEVNGFEPMTSCVQGRRSPS